jgi:hypothetical protein
VLFGRVVAVVEADAHDLGRLDGRQDVHTLCRNLVALAKGSEDVPVHKTPPPLALCNVTRAALMLYAVETKHLSDHLMISSRDSEGALRLPALSTATTV